MKNIFLLTALFLMHSHFLNAQSGADKLEVVAELPVRPGNIAVSKNGRIFATIHSLGSSELQLIEVIGKTIFKPYPEAGFQKNGKPASEKSLDAPLGISIDKNDHLWVVDMGSNLGKTRIFCFDIKKNKLINKIELNEFVAPKGSFIQDLAVDEINGWIYLADIANPAIIAVNIKTNKARRFSNHSALESENRDMIIDGKLTYFSGKPARIAIDPITISSDKNTLYFGAMNATAWYKVSTLLFRTNADDTTIANAIQVAGRKPISDGALTDSEGNHYFTNVSEHAVSKLDVNGNLSNIIQDERLLWPDNVAIHNDWMYICTNQLNTTPTFTGDKDLGKAPYFIYRFKYAENKTAIENKYTLDNISLYPEGIDYDFNNNRFIVGSLYKAEVYTMSLKGVLTPFIKESKMTAVLGIFTDEVRNRLIVVGGDLGLSKKSVPQGASAGSEALVEVYNLETGKLLKTIDLKFLTPNSGALANDVTVDEDGNIYVTDSYSPIIYKVDRQYNASVFVTNELFKATPNSFGLNGIVFHPDGYLLTAKTDGAKLFKIPLSNPSQVTEVTGISFKAPDGLEWTKDYKLIIAGDAVAGNGKVYTISSADNWKTASLDSEMNIGKDQFPTTAALATDGKVYVVSAKLGKLLSGDTKQSDFTIQVIKN